MKRETLITVALVIAGIILAFVLFGAGACWKSRSFRTSRQVAPVKVSPPSDAVCVLAEVHVRAAPPARLAQNVAPDCKSYALPTSAG
jgi:hypothetical protein